VRRTLAGVAAWILGAAASLAVGMLALSTVGGPGIAAPPDNVAAQPLDLPDLPDSPAPLDSPVDSPASPDSPLASSSQPTPSSIGRSTAGTRRPTPPTTPTPLASPVQRRFTTVGGELTASCTGQVVYLVSWSPAPGYRTDDVRRGPGSVAHLTFEGSPPPVVAWVKCTAGIPQLTTTADT